MYPLQMKDKDVRDFLSNWSHSFFRDMLGSAPSENESFLPTLDIQEAEEGLNIAVDLPGVKRTDVDVTYEDGVLTISGEKRQEQSAQSAEGEAVKWHRVERRYGRFSRSITIPGAFDHEQVDARMSDGLLTLAIPRRPESKPRKIEVGGEQQSN